MVELAWARTGINSQVEVGCSAYLLNDMLKVTNSRGSFSGVCVSPMGLYGWPSVGLR